MNFSRKDNVKIIAKMDSVFWASRIDMVLLFQRPTIVYIRWIIGFQKKISYRNMQIFPPSFWKGYSVGLYSGKWPLKSLQKNAENEQQLLRVAVWIILKKELCNWAWQKQSSFIKSKISLPQTNRPRLDISEDKMK